jgi:hypothetical protein
MNNDIFIEAYKRCKVAWGGDSLPDLDEIQTDFNSRISAVATAFPPVRGIYRIEFSLPYIQAYKMLTGSTKMVVDVTIHELGHVYQFYHVRTAGHNELFRRLMRAANVFEGSCLEAENKEYIPGTTITHLQMNLMARLLKAQGCGNA